MVAPKRDVKGIPSQEHISYLVNVVLNDHFLFLLNCFHSETPLSSSQAKYFHWSIGPLVQFSLVHGFFWIK